MAAMITTLSPMLIQYLVGLCCLRWSPEDVDVTVGDFVLDQAAEKARDVDVTVRVTDTENGNYAFVGYEVKREAKPLDVAVIEQLALKLRDMESISHRAIVSTSGYTDSAKKKAKAHGVALYELKPWQKSMHEQFPVYLQNEGKAEDKFKTARIDLVWMDQNAHIDFAEALSEFQIKPSDFLFKKSGKRHSKFSTFSEYENEVYFRSTEILLKTKNVQNSLNEFLGVNPLHEQQESAPAWAHTHSLDILSDEVYLQVDGKLCRMKTFTVSGKLQWRIELNQGLYYIMEEVDTGVPFAGAIVIPEVRDGRMTALVLSPASRQINVHCVHLLEKQLNILRQIDLKRPSDKPVDLESVSSNSIQQKL